jgi:predicted permease
MASLFQDVRHSLRFLAKSPGFTAVAVLVLALGIGANSAIFSLANTLLLKPQPQDRLPGTLVGVFSQDRTRPDSYRAFSYPNYADIRDTNQVFSDLMAHSLSMVGITEGDTTRRTFASIVSSNYFRVMNGHLAAGRGFTPEEERPGRQALVAIVSHPYWQKKGGGDGILGSTIRVNGRDFEIVGVTGKDFTGSMVLMTPELFLPLGVYELVVNDLFQDGSAHTRLNDRETEALVLAGRLRPGVTEAAAAPQLEQLARRLEEAYPAANKNQTLVTHRLPRMGTSTGPRDDGEFFALLGLLQAMAGLVLLIACLNLANMLLARSSARRREIGIRLALGSGRARIVRQLLIEGLALSLAGGAAGLLVGVWAMGLLVTSFAGAIPFGIDVVVAMRPDARVLAAALGFAVASTLIFGLWPAWRLAKTDVVTELKQQAGDQPGGASRRWLSLRHALVVSQIALSLALLTAGGLFLRSAVAAAGADPGFEFRQGLAAGIDPSLAGYDERRGRQIYRDLLDRVRALPGVKAASVATLIPYGEVTEGERVRRPGTTGETGRASAIANIIGADYFAALGLPVLRGREFTRAEGESAAGAPVAIIDEPLARTLFPNEDPLGQPIVFVKDDESTKDGPFEIVGVVPGLRHDLYDREPVAHVYTSFGQHYRSWTNLHVKLAGGGREAEAAALEAVRRTVRGVDERLPMLWLKTLEDYRATNFFLWIARAGAKLFTTFGALALFLAVVGLYGVKAYLVSLRTREIGVRLALGASPRDVLWMILRDGLALTGVGIVVGLGLAALVALAVSRLVYQSSPFDPVVFTLGPIVLAAAAMAATWIPARRAMRVQPIVALRAE